MCQGIRRFDGETVKTVLSLFFLSSLIVRFAFCTTRFEEKGNLGVTLLFGRCIKGKTKQHKEICDVHLGWPEVNNVTEPPRGPAFFSKNCR